MRFTDLVSRFFMVFYLFNSLSSVCKLFSREYFSAFSFTRAGILVLVLWYFCLIPLAISISAFNLFISLFSFMILFSISMHLSLSSKLIFDLYCSISFLTSFISNSVFFISFYSYIEFCLSNFSVFRGIYLFRMAEYFYLSLLIFCSRYMFCFL